VDVLVEFERPADLVDLQLRLQSVLGVEKFHVVMRDCVYPALRDNILGGAIDVDREAMAVPR
jgi:predicted nucleotidyltransferase